MSAGIVEPTQRYYRAFGSKGDFASVPMADHLRFTGPLHAYTDGARYWRDCTKLAATARGIRIRHQFFDQDQVHTVYDFDLGLPSGPIASSETLTFDDGVLIAADPVIDSTPLRAMTPSSDS